MKLTLDLSPLEAKNLEKVSKLCDYENPEDFLHWLLTPAWLQFIVQEVESQKLKNMLEEWKSPKRQ